MDILYKIGLVGILLLMVITIPMFLVYEEMAILIPLNILLFGLPILLLYFVLVFVYQRLSKIAFTVVLIVLLSVPTFYFGKQIYNDYAFNNRYKEWKDFSNTVQLTLDKEIIINYSPNQTDLLKYSFMIPKDGTLVVRVHPNIAEELLIINIFNSKPDKWIVSSPNHKTRGIHVSRVKKGETYYMNVDQTRLNYTGTGSYVIKALVEENLEYVK